MFRRQRVIVVIPAFNEADLIETTLRGVPEFVDRVVVVDDASTDRTRHRIRSQRARVEVLRHTENRGVGAAIVSGYARALGLGADVIVVMAGDNQMDPADLPSLLTPILEGRADYVKGNRLRHPRWRQMPFGRRLAGRVLGRLTSIATGYAIGDSQCGYTAIHANVAAKLPLESLWPRYGYPNDLLGLLASRGFRVVEVPVRPVYAGEQSGIRPYHAAVVVGVIVRRYVMSLCSGAPGERSAHKERHPEAPQPPLDAAYPQSALTAPRSPGR